MDIKSKGIKLRAINPNYKTIELQFKINNYIILKAKDNHEK